MQITKAIQEYFPEDTQLTRPNGGISLWVVLSPKIKHLKLHEEAVEQGSHLRPAPSPARTATRTASALPTPTLERRPGGYSNTGPADEDKRILSWLRITLIILISWIFTFGFF